MRLKIITQERVVFDEDVDEIYSKGIDGEFGVLTTLAEAGEEIDEARAREALERAKRRLREANARLDAKRAEAAIARAEARLKAKLAN